MSAHSVNGCSTDLQAGMTEALCAATGARLCTLAELMTGQLSNMQCGILELNYWTSTTAGCTDPTIQRVMFGPGGGCLDPQGFSDGAVCCAWTECTQPSDISGYDVVNTELRVAIGFSVIAACATGYEGTAVATSCAIDGDYSLSGCTSIVCTSPASTVGYDFITETNLDLSTGALDVTVSCATGYEGVVSAVACPTADGPYALTGCEPIVCTRPPLATVPCHRCAGPCHRCGTAGYTSIIETNLDLSVGLFDVSVACNIGWEGTAATSCVTDGPYVLSGCTSIVCVRPADVTGYIIEEDNIDLSTSEFAATASCAPGYVNGSRLVGTEAATACTTSLTEYTLSGCSLCGAGQFKVGSGPGKCEPCAAGRYNPTLGSAECIGCPAGKYVDLTQSDQLSDCIDCVTSKYVDVAGSDEPTDCIDCPAGQHTGVAASVSCIGCVIGRYSTLIGSVSPSDCIDCAAGTFSNTVGEATCNLCPQGTYTPGTVWACRECARGRSDSDSDPATPCSSPVLCAAVPNEERCLDEVCAWATEDAKCWTVDEAVAKQREDNRRMMLLGTALAAAGVACMCCCYYTIAAGKPKVDPDKWAQRVAVKNAGVSAFSAGTAPTQQSGQKAAQAGLRLAAMKAKRLANNP